MKFVQESPEQGTAGVQFAGEAGLHRLALAACRRMLSLFKVDGAAVLVGGDTEPRIVAQAGRLCLDPLTHGPVRELVGLALAQGRTERTLAGSGNASQAIVTPFRLESGLKGVIVMERASGRLFSDSELAQSTLLAESLGMTLQLHQIGDQMRRSEAQYRLLFQRNPLPMYVANFEDRRFIAANPEALRLYEYDETSFLQLHSWDLIRHLPQNEIDRLMRETAPHQKIQRLVGTQCTGTGRVIDVELWTDAIEFEGRMARLVLVYDITDQVLYSRELARVSRAQQMLSDCNEAVIRCSNETDLYARVCGVATSIGGYRRALVTLACDDAERSLSVAQWPGQPDDVLRRLRLSWDPDRPGGHGPSSQVIRTGQPRVIDDVAQHRSELLFPDETLALGYSRMVFLPLQDGERTFGVLNLMSDEAHGSTSASELALLMQLAHNFAHGIGLLRARQQRQHDAMRIMQLAYSDGLTGLPNRARLIEHLQERVSEAQAQGHWASLLLLDIHNLKALNEVWGHGEGDLLLKRFAQRLQLNAPGVCARLGADEFVVLLGPHGSDEGEAMREVELSAARLLSVLAHDHHGEGWVFECQSSAGLVLFNGHDGGTSELLQRAEMALYAAKTEGPQAVRRYDRELHATVVERVQLEQALREALSQRQFELYYQPQCDAHGEWLGAEALVRWRHPSKGWVSPGAFIPACEESGLILKLGEQVLEMACATLSDWQTDDRLGALVLAVNVSARQFRQPEFVRQVLKALAVSGAPAHRLKLELTESVMVDDVERVIEKMKALRQRGVSFSLDDFGTGYSSLGQLKRLPLDQVKIDQSFVRDVLTDPNDASIVQAVIQLGASLGLNVIAEGVETTAQRDALAHFGCRVYQGYLIGKPMPRAAFERCVSDAQCGESGGAPLARCPSTLS